MFLYQDAYLQLVIDMDEQSGDKTEKDDASEKLREAWMKFVQNAGEGISAALLQAMEAQKSTYQALGMEAEFEKMKSEVEGYAKKMKEDVVSSLFSSFENFKISAKSEEQVEAYKKMWEDAARLMPPAIDLKKIQEMQIQIFETYGRVLKEFLDSDAFGKALSINLNSMLDARRKLIETNDQIAATLGLPTRAEVDELSKKVTELWREVNTLSQALSAKEKKKKR